MNEYIISENIVKGLISYLNSRPYGEVHQGIESLKKLEKLERQDKEDTNKKKDK